MMISILWGCLFILLGAACIAIFGAVRERWTIWNSPVNRALRARGRDPMQRAFGDMPHAPDGWRP